MQLVASIADEVGTRRACEAVQLPRSTFYRRRGGPKPTTRPSARKSSHRALSGHERQRILEILHEPRFVDRSPWHVYAALLEEDAYIGSPRTMYRILEQNQEVRERRNQLRHPEYKKPELLATGPNQVWSWDITKLRAAIKWEYYHLYVVLDIFSRYVVAWMLAHRESGDFAAQLLERAYKQQRVAPDQVIVHADRGTAATSKTLAQMLADLTVERSFSRPQVSNDNPYSESQFKTMKYMPDYPDRFGSYEDALSFCRSFFHWYNHEHRHSGISYLAPAAVHAGDSQRVLARRQRTLDLAYAQHPERFVRGCPQQKGLPNAVWINPPEDRARKEIVAP